MSPVSPVRLPIRSYGSFAWCYDELAAFYSAGRIKEVKLAQVAELEPGDRVFFAGAGRGHEAIAAARLGAQVTCMDVAPKMVSRLERGFAKAELDATLLSGDVFEHVPSALYDVVAANFFLNLFSEAHLQVALSQLRSLLRPGGRLLIADFGPPAGTRSSRVLSHVYYRPLNWGAFILGLCDLHPSYDYAPALGLAGFEVARRRAFPLFSTASRASALATVGYELIVATCRA